MVLVLGSLLARFGLVRGLALGSILGSLCARSGIALGVLWARSALARALGQKVSCKYSAAMLPSREKCISPHTDLQFWEIRKSLLWTRGTP